MPMCDFRERVAGFIDDPPGRLIVVSDQAYHRCVVSEFDDDVGAVCGCTVMCVQGVQEWAEDAALRSTSVQGQRR